MTTRGFYWAAAAVAGIVVAGVAVVAAFGGDQSSSTIGQLFGFGGLLLVAMRNAMNVTDTKATVDAAAEKIDEVHSKLNGQLTATITAAMLEALNTKYPEQWGKSAPAPSPPQA